MIWAILLLTCVWVLVLSKGVRAVSFPASLPTKGKQQNFPPKSPAAIALKNVKRNAEFWKRVATIYLSYKALQVRELVSPLTKTNSTKSDGAWTALHELNSQRMVDLCLSLRGFYLKSGQFLGTRHDFMPPAYTSKLSRLHDQVPPMDEEEVRQIIEKELPGPISSYLSSLNLTHPIGSASIAQVHEGRWLPTGGQRVAVKVQNPESEVLMKSDLHNLCTLAEFLQRTELKFDVLSALRELRSQISNEFDFQREALNMDYMHNKLSHIKEIIIPKSVYSTKKLLVMSFVEGENMSKLAQRNTLSTLPLFVKRRVGQRIFSILAKAWAEQIFKLQLFHGDPHPGNICLQGGIALGGGRIGLLDWGQVKHLSNEITTKYAELVLALAQRDEGKIIERFLGLGVVVTHPQDKESVEALAITMLDTRTPSHIVLDPFHPQAMIKRNGVKTMPSELYFIVRAVQLMRGMSHAFCLEGEGFSLAEIWQNEARDFLARQKNN